MVESAKASEADISKVKPTANQIIVRVIAPPEMTPGGILLTKGVQEKALEKALVLTTGPGRITEQGVALPMLCKAGDTILFDKYAGSEIRISGEVLRIMRDVEVKAIIEDTNLKVDE